jgi:hypothetical protein
MRHRGMQCFRTEYSSVFRIRDILVLIRKRIRILGSVPLTDPYQNLQRLSGCKKIQKINFFLFFNVFLL